MKFRYHKATPVLPEWVTPMSRQVVVMHDRPVALDGDLAPEVVNSAGGCLGVLEEDLGLVNHGGDECGRIVGFALVVGDDDPGQPGKRPGEAHLLPGEIVISGMRIQQRIHDIAGFELRGHLCFQA